jgi:hypothetical protein
MLGVGPYDESLGAEDRDMYIRLLARDALGYTPHLVGQYRVHPANVAKIPALLARAIAAGAISERRNAARFSVGKRMALHLSSAHRRARLRANALQGPRALPAKATRYALATARNALLAWHDRRIARTKAQAPGTRL